MNSINLMKSINYVRNNLLELNVIKNKQYIVDIIKMIRFSNRYSTKAYKCCLFDKRKIKMVKHTSPILSSFMHNHYLYTRIQCRSCPLIVLENNNYVCMITVFKKEAFATNKFLTNTELTNFIRERMMNIYTSNIKPYLDTIDEK